MLDQDTITCYNSLVLIAVNPHHEDAAWHAIEKLGKVLVHPNRGDIQEDMAFIASSPTSTLEARKKALEYVEDEEQLAGIANASRHEEIISAAVKKIDSVFVLAELYEDTQNETVKNAAREQLLIKLKE